MDDIKPCPLCGNKARVETSQADTAFRVACVKIFECGLTQHWFDSEKEAIDAWNRRKK